MKTNVILHGVFKNEVLELATKAILSLYTPEEVIEINDSIVGMDGEAGIARVFAKHLTARKQAHGDSSDHWRTLALTLNRMALG